MNIELSVVGIKLLDFYSTQTLSFVKKILQNSKEISSKVIQMCCYHRVKKQNKQLYTEK